jgi:hypothetical protein
MQITTSKAAHTYMNTDVRWQGAHWRRLCRFSVAFFLAIILGFSWVTNPPSASQLIAGIIVVALVCALSEWLFARRMGVEIQQDAVTLCGPFRRTRIPWTQVQGLVWRDALSFSRTKYLCLETNSRAPRRIPQNAPVRIPTIACSSESSLPNDRLLGRLLTSPDIRSPAGEEVDAVKTIEQAWNAGR